LVNPSSIFVAQIRGLMSETQASFEPGIDCGVTKIPRFGFEVLVHGHQTELETLFDFGCYNYAALTALRKGGRETLKEKLKPYLQTGEWSD
jgi:hypothetical protein